MKTTIKWLISIIYGFVILYFTLGQYLLYLMKIVGALIQLNHFAFAP